MSGDTAAGLIGAERTRISHIERGRVDVPRNGLYKLLRAYQCPEGAYFDSLMDMAHESGRGWWNGFSDTIGRRAGTWPNWNPARPCCAPTIPW